MFKVQQMGALSLSESVSYAKRAYPFTVVCTGLGAAAFLMADILDKGSIVDMRQAVPVVLMGAAAGGVIGTGAGIAYHAGQDGRMAPATIAFPALLGGGAMAVTKYRRPSTDVTGVLSIGAIAALTGLALGYGWDQLRS